MADASAEVPSKRRRVQMDAITLARMRLYIAMLQNDEILPLDVLLKVVVCIPVVVEERRVLHLFWAAVEENPEKVM